MYSNNMTGSIPEALGDLEQLTYLNLGGNQLEGSIPEAMGDLKQLQYLQLGGDRIEGSIPQALAGLDQLTVLGLWSNRLTGVVPSLPFKNYTNGCYLQDPTSPSNHYTCPLPPVSPLNCVHDVRRMPRPPLPCPLCATCSQTNARPNTTWSLPSRVSMLCARPPRFAATCDAAAAAESPPSQHSLRPHAMVSTHCVRT